MPNFNIFSEYGTLIFCLKLVQLVRICCAKAMYVVNFFNQTTDNITSKQQQKTIVLGLINYK